MKIELNHPFVQEKIKAQIALTQVIDPELEVNIIDLGLVYDVDFSKTSHVRVTMTFSTPHCPLGDAIKQGVIYALSTVFPDYKVDIDIVWEPEWNYHMITDAGKLALGIEPS